MYILILLFTRQWLIAHSDSFKKWFENWETVEKYIQLVHESSLVLDRKEFQGGNRKEIGKSAKSVFKNSFPAKVNKSGRVEPSSITNRYGEQIYIPITGIKELIRHSADANTLQLIPNLKSIIKIATFLFEKEIDPSRKKKLNQSTKVYKYYGLKVKLEGKEYWARLIIREEKNGRKYFYDGDLKEIKKEPPQTVGPDPKNGGRSEKALFTHSIQEWLTNVKEVIDKIGDNGEILSEVIEQFNNESKYYQTMVPDKDLVVYHNVSERNLETAMELGALPMPSLAITRKDIDFGNFGEITLIGNKDMVDPRKSRSNEVYSRDAYTVRKPVVNYEQPSEEVEEAFHKKDETLDMDLAQLIKDIGDVKAGNKHGFPENQSFIKHIHSFWKQRTK